MLSIPSVQSKTNSMSTLKIFFLNLLVLVVTGAPGLSAQTNTPSPCNSKPEYRQFDFWIGEWEVTNADGQFLGMNKIELILDGCVVLENWTSASPNYSGKSFNYYNSIRGKWEQKWIDNQGISIEFEGLYDADNKSLNYVGKGFNPADSSWIDYKLTFYNISEDYMRQIWEQSSDGENWTTLFDGHYRRKAEN